MPFGWRKKKEKPLETTEIQGEARKPTELEEMCTDKGTYEALFHTMLLNPKYIEVSMEDAAKKGREAEKRKDTEAARRWYEMAGGLAIYEGNVQKVIEYFGKAQKTSGMKYPILDKVEQAVAMAQQYYKKCLK
jgi:hypothetical protein